jgi:maltose alpha-D-glucosyltransferase/alpha-amylase
VLSLEFAAPQHESLPPNDLLADLAPGALTLAHDLIGSYLDRVQLLGRRTAELHAALAAPDDREFMSVPSTQLYQRSLYQSMRNVHRRALDELSSRQLKLPPEEAALAERVVAASDRILGRFQGLLYGRYGGQRIRIHGDYNLWEVLFTGKDFAIIDFEGDHWRTLSERRIKRSPLVDVAAMIRSFDYAVSSALLRDAGPFRGRARGIVRDEDLVRLRPWAQFWLRSVASLFWKAYRESTAASGLLPSTPEAVRELLDIFLLERTLQELTHELQNRPKWVSIPLRELARMVEV